MDCFFCLPLKPILLLLTSHFFVIIIMTSSKQLKKEYIMTKLKTPNTFETDKCTNIVDKFVYWFDELLKIKLDEIVEDGTALHNRALSFTEKDIPNNLQALVAYTWFKFSYFCHTKKEGKLPDWLEDLELDSDILELELISTNTFLREGEHHFTKNYFDELTNSINQSNYLATSFAIAGWNLFIKNSYNDGICYMLKWDKTNTDYTKMLPKITDKYTDRVITPVTAPKVKLQLSFNQKEFYDWFNQELNDFYASLSKADKLKYSIDKEVIIDINQIPKKYYELITDVPVQGDRYIDFVEPFVELLRANNWEIKPESLGNTITLVYTGKNN